jgi:hypothetical protein
LEDEDREQLRGCLALFHKELRKRKKLYEDMQKEADTLKGQIEAMNTAKELSEDPFVESPRKKTREEEKKESARPPTVVNWSWLGGSSASSTAPSTTTGPAKV